MDDGFRQLWMTGVRDACGAFVMKDQRHGEGLNLRWRAKLALATFGQNDGGTDDLGDFGQNGVGSVLGLGQRKRRDRH